MEQTNMLSVVANASSGTNLHIDSWTHIPSLELAVVIPTYNERENISILLGELQKTLAGREWEAIFVDDNSPDGTAEEIRRLAVKNLRVHVLERIGRRGLSSACIEGLLATAAPYIAVMDADLQHDESALPKMFTLITSEQLDIVVGSRNASGGSVGELPKRRAILTRLGSRLSPFIHHSKTSDPMSGFFIIRRGFFHQVVHLLSGAGFKILVDILASSPRPVRLGEIPYHFRKRSHGKSKLDFTVELEYLYLLLDKSVGGIVPTPFVLFVLVGSLGFLIHLCVLVLLYHATAVSFILSQVAATFVAMTFNFVLNNITTFRDRRLRGWQLLGGLLTFYLACSLGTLINVTFAQKLLSSGIPWYLAGITGMLISSVWNYGVNSSLTWRRTRTLASSTANTHAEYPPGGTI